MNIANRWVFIAGLIANILLVLWTFLAFDQEWTGAFWPLFSVWTGVIVLFVLLAFVAGHTAFDVLFHSYRRPIP